MAALSDLSPETAQRAVMVLFDLLPAEFWEDGVKPALAELEAFAEELSGQAPAPLKPVLEAACTPADSPVKGELARLVLAEFSRQEALRPYVERAVATATERHMAPLPLIIGAVIVTLAALPTELRVEKGKVVIRWGNLAKVGEVLKQLAELVKYLPPEVLQSAGGPGSSL